MTPAGEPSPLLDLILDGPERLRDNPQRHDTQRTAIIEAALHGRRDVVAFLLDREPDLSFREPRFGATALGAARYAGDPELVAAARGRATLGEVSSGAAPSFATPQSVARLRARTVARRLAIAVFGLLLIAAIGGFVYLGSLRGVGDAQQRATRIMAAHHEPAGMPAPARLVAAVVSVEDEHFNDNVAVNVLSGVGRAGLAAVDGGADPGGSTIEQQLARQLYPGGSTLHDIGLGVKLALSYDKAQIMRMYLNVGYYGHGFWGVTQAAAGYFGAAPTHLTWAEAAMLGGLLQAPSDYDPLAHYALARARERHVLQQLVVNHHLSPREAAAALAASVPLR